MTAGFISYSLLLMHIGTHFRVVEGSLVQFFSAYRFNYIWFTLKFLEIQVHYQTSSELSYTIVTTYYTSAETEQIQERLPVYHQEIP
jgi:hypothetical protein